MKTTILINTEVVQVALEPETDWEREALLKFDGELVQITTHVGLADYHERQGGWTRNFASGMDENKKALYIVGRKAKK